MHGRIRMTNPCIPTYNAGTEHVGFSPTRQTFLAPNVKRREVFSESHKESAILLRAASEAGFGTLCVLACIWMTASNSLKEGGGFRPQTFLRPVE